MIILMYLFNEFSSSYKTTQSAGAVEYADYTSAEK